MSDTTFTNGTVITSSWLNDANKVVYSQVDGVSGLRSLDGSRFFYAETRYRASIGDAGSAKYIQDLTDTTSADNGTTIIVANDGKRWKMQILDVLSPLAFGAVFDGTTDDTNAINSAILALATVGNGTIVFPPKATCSITGTIYIPTGIQINLNGCEILGGGIGVNTIFETGYVSSGALITNVGTAAESHRVTGASVFNGVIRNCNKAFNLYNFNELSSVHDIQFFDCTYAIYSERPFYSSYSHLISRNSANSATNAAFYFTTFVNIVEINSISVVNRLLGMQIANGAYSLTMQNCSFEQGTAGVLFTGVCNSISIKQNYFESLTGNAIELSGAGSSFTGTTVDYNWFNLVATCINATNMTGKWGRNNTRNSGVCYVDFSASTNLVEIEIPHAYSATNITPSTPSWLTYSTRCIISQDVTLYNTSSGLATVRAKNSGERPISLPYYGDSGDPVTGVIAFCTSVSSSPGSTPFSVIIDTKIISRATSVVVYNLKITDNVGTYNMYGTIYGTSIDARDSSGKTMTVSVSGGNLRLTAGTFSHPSGTFTATGIVRHV